MKKLPVILLAFVLTGTVGFAQGKSNERGKGKNKE
jgi:hypothetical protein